MSASKHYDRFFTKRKLEKEYKNKSICDIAKKFNISQTCMYRIFIKFNIQRRKCNTNGILASGFKHGRCTTSLPKFCKCGKKLSNNPNAKHCIKCHNYLNSINKDRLNKISEFMKNGWKNNNFAKLLHSKKIQYKNIWMRSSWEVKYAQYLDKNNIKWLYESKTFDLGNTTYTPDFYLPETDIYIEIKGYLRPNSKNKIKLFNKYFKNLKVLNKQELILMGVL